MGARAKARSRAKKNGTHWNGSGHNGSAPVARVVGTQSGASPAAIGAQGLMQAEWKSYSQEALPAGASSYQIEETKRAFFAGAFSLLDILISKSRVKTGAAGKKFENTVDLIAQLNDEMNAFARAIVEAETAKLRAAGIDPDGIGRSVHAR